MKKRYYHLTGLLALLLAVSMFSGCGKKNTEATETVSAGDQTKAQELLTKGKAYLNDEDYENAAETLLKCVDADPSGTEAYELLSKVYYELGEYDSMEAVLSKGYQTTGDESLKDSWVSCLDTVSQLYLYDEDYENAILWLEKLAAATEETPEIMYQIGNAYSMMDEYEKALTYLEKADSSDADVQAALLEAEIRYGEQCIDDGNYEKAITNLRQVIDTNPDAIEAYTLLISAYIGNQQLDEAKTVIDAGMERFLAAGAEDKGELLDGFLTQASDYYSEREDMSGGLSFWQKVVALRPNNTAYQEELQNYRSLAADDAYMKAEELLESGDVTGASSYYKQAFALAPSIYEEGLITLDSGTYCLAGDGSLRTGWYTDEVGGRYYFSTASGSGHARALTGWQHLDGSDYYFDEDGLMVVDDVTPDGRYVGSDGRVTENPDQTEETDAEDETEEEEDDESGSSSGNSGSSSGSGSSGSSSQVSYGSGVTIVRPGTTQTTESGTLRLNPDALQSAKDSKSSVSFEKSGLFYGGGNSDFTLDAILGCLEQYGKPQWTSLQEPYAVQLYDLQITIHPGDDWDSENTDQTSGSRADSLFERILPDDTTFTVLFTDGASKTKLSISRVKKINE